MDAKQLFWAYQNKYHLTNWLDNNGELAQSQGKIKWTYCGVSKDFKDEIVSQAINNTFTDDEVYLCISSNKSSLVSKSTAVNEIRNILHKKEVGILNKSFTKIIFFNQYGTFASGIIREFHKSRPRPAGTPLNVRFHANIVDSSTGRIADIISKHFDNLETELHNDYGGSMEYLWIDLELVENHLKKQNSWPFRFQKRVDVPASYTEFYSYNVGHYSVKPDFEKLKELLSEEEICTYIFGLLYESTKILVDKQKSLEGFDATTFRLDFFSACKKLGYYTC